MKKYYYILISFFLGNCAPTWRLNLAIEGNEDEAILNAITDFSHSCKLRKEDKAFSVTVYIDDNDIIGLSISGQRENKLYPGPEDTIGNYTNRLPTKYVEKNGKLYYWYDSFKPINEKNIQVLSKYNLLDSTYINGFNGEIPGYIRYRKKKAAHYYFCKNNLKDYKKVITHVAMGWYKAPKLKCKPKKENR